MPTVPVLNNVIGKKTSHRCKVCAISQNNSDATYMVVRQVIDTTTSLQCPNCETNEYVPTNSLRLP